VLELGDGTKAPGTSSVPTSSIKDNGKRVTWNECGVPTAGGVCWCDRLVTLFFQLSVIGVMKKMNPIFWGVKNDKT
jgi:hypothetical protein